LEQGDNDDEEATGLFKQIAYKNGLSTRQAEGVYEQFNTGMNIPAIPSTLLSSKPTALKPAFALSIFSSYLSPQFSFNSVRFLLILSSCCFACFSLRCIRA
jgi:hypothetical protein